MHEVINLMRLESRAPKSAWPNPGVQYRTLLAARLSAPLSKEDDEGSVIIRANGEGEAARTAAGERRAADAGVLAQAA